MSAFLPILRVEDEAVVVTPHAEHEFVVASKDVARGYGVSDSSIREHKRAHADELTEGKHWVVRISDTLGGRQETTLWTKRGIIRLGFFIRSERAKLFRDAAEDLVLGKIDQPADPMARLLDATRELIALGVSADLAANLASGACLKSLPTKTKAATRIEKLAPVCADVLPPGEQLRWTDLREKIEERYNLSVRSAERWITHMLRAGLIRITPGLRYAAAQNGGAA